MFHKDFNEKKGKQLDIGFQILKQPQFFDLNQRQSIHSDVLSMLVQRHEHKGSCGLKIYAKSWINSRVKTAMGRLFHPAKFASSIPGDPT